MPLHGSARKPAPALASQHVHFVAQQREMRERGKTFASNDTEAVAGLASRNYQRWKSVQDEIYSTLVRAAGRGAEDDEMANAARARQ